MLFDGILPVKPGTTFTTALCRVVAFGVAMYYSVSQLSKGYNMILFTRANELLSRLPPMAVYAVGAADAVLIVYLASLVAKFSA
jgi:hypothetical protein